MARGRRDTPRSRKSRITASTRDDTRFSAVGKGITRARSAVTVSHAPRATVRFGLLGSLGRDEGFHVLSMADPNTGRGSAVIEAANDDVVHAVLPPWGLGPAAALIASAAAL